MASPAAPPAPASQTAFADRLGQARRNHPPRHAGHARSPPTRSTSTTPLGLFDQLPYEVRWLAGHRLACRCTALIPPPTTTSNPHYHHRCHPQLLCEVLTVCTSEQLGRLATTCRFFYTAPEISAIARVHVYRIPRGRNLMPDEG